MKRLVLIAILLVSVLVVGTGLTAAQDGHIVERIRDRGELICGVNSYFRVSALRMTPANSKALTWISAAP